MSYFDVFNGDADGMCALHQLRLAEPRDAIRITGLKREIALLQRVRATAGDSVTVLDVSIDVNRSALDTLLARGASVQYFDHHGAGEPPPHPRLEAWIDRTRETCTGMIVDRYLQGRYRKWAIVAAFGDNLHRSAERLALSTDMNANDVVLLQKLGECLNYNAYGDTDADPVLHPASLYTILERHENPFDFIHQEPIFQLLCDARRNDLDQASNIQPLSGHHVGSIYILPDAAWSRRVRGEFCNLLANRDPKHAHAVLTPNVHDGFSVSIRVPVGAPQAAGDFCAQFSTGGGRAGAAGITHLPADALSAFIHVFGEAYSCTVQ